MISATKQPAKNTPKSAKSTPTEKTRKIHGVFDEIRRPQVAKGSDEEGKWANKNLGRAYKILKEQGIIKQTFLLDADLENIPTEWLKVLKKYCSIADKYTARNLAEELNKRK